MEYDFRTARAVNTDNTRNDRWEVQAKGDDGQWWTVSDSSQMREELARDLAATMADIDESGVELTQGDLIQYQLAYAKEDGNWDIVEDFEASNDAEANAYADQCYPHTEWYVLRNGSNINS